MEDTLIVVMLKDPITGFLEKEIASCKIIRHEELMVNIYAKEYAEEGVSENYMVYMKLTVDRDVEDWEFSAIYDYYDSERLAPEIVDFKEVEDCYNPTWEVSFKFDENLEHKILAILDLHREEINDVFAAISEHRNEYEPENLQ